MENLIEALKTTQLFLNVLGYKTSINFEVLECQNFIHQKKNFHILNKDEEEVGNISYYDFNKKILISIVDEESNITGKLDVATLAPHKVNGYLGFDDKYHMALEMRVNSNYLHESIVNFKGEYIKNTSHIAFTIGNDCDFWLSKANSQSKEMLKINIQDKTYNNPLIKHTFIIYESVPIITSEKICQVSPTKLEGIKEANNVIKVNSLSYAKENLVILLGNFMKSLNPRFQESIITFNCQLKGLLARFLTVALSDYSQEEFKLLFGLEKEEIELENEEKVLARMKN